MMKAQGMLYAIAQKTMNSIHKEAPDTIEPEVMEDAAKNAAAELKFWEDVKARGFEVPTSGKIHAVAVRWQRKCKADKAFKQRYESEIGGEAKKRFRTKWAQEKYETAVEKRKEIQQRWKKSRTKRTGMRQWTPPNQNCHPGEGATPVSRAQLCP